MSGDRPITDVLNDIVSNIQDIVHSEIRLASAEVRQELHVARYGGIAIAIGLLASLFSVAFLLLSIAYALALVMPNWLATLCVGLALVPVALVILRIGRRRLQNRPPTAPKTIASVKENLEWAKQQIK